MTAQTPHLVKQGATTLLMVDGSPLLIRGGELGNSSSERTFLAPHWERLKDLGLNAVLAPVYWDVLEPVEGQFDFAHVDDLLEDARANGMRLVLLWFGSWKNSMSCYVPGWVKADVARFPRARTSRGAALEILSPFHAVNAETDARAFAALMAHLHEVDEQHTVVMVQVENEIGMIPEARDHCEAAEAAWAGPVPQAILDYLPTSPEGSPLRTRWQAAGGALTGCWAEVFGESFATEELFQAWHFATYVQAVCEAGRAEKDLPLYTNAALIRPGAQPGQYPSAGPLPHLAELWRIGAPALDFIAPDIYFPNFDQWAGAYVESGNPLFVPEALRTVDAAANCLYAFGRYGAIGFSPFHIESVEGNPARMISGAYDVVTQLEPLIAAHAGHPTMTGLLPPGTDMRYPHRIRFGDVILHASFEQVPAPALADGVINETGQAAGTEHLPAAAIIIDLGDDEYVVGGIGVVLTFEDPRDPSSTVGILSADEGRYEAGVWKHLRWLNGDQTHQGRHIRLEPGRFTVQRFKLYRYN
jgi:beta-galactosidase GanA